MSEPIYQIGDLLEQVDSAGKTYCGLIVKKQPSEYMRGSTVYSVFWADNKTTGFYCGNELNDWLSEGHTKLHKI